MNWWVLRRNIHASWLIAVISAGVLLGVILAQNVPQGLFGSPAWFVVGLGLMVFGLWRKSLYVIAVVLAAGILVGLWRGSIEQQALQPYKNVVNHTATVIGRLSEDTDAGKKGEQILRLDVLSVDGHELGGKAWVSVSDKADIKRSDVVTVKGKMSEGFGNFSAVMYRAVLEKVKRPVPGDVALSVRDEFAENIRKAVPDPEAALGIGYLVGQRRSLPPELDEALKTAGLTHIVVASGYNLTILVRLARRLFVKISKYLSVLFAGGMIVAFMGITGLSPSMSRAGLVAGLSLLAWYYGRKFHPLVLLPFAAAVTVLINPSFAWGDLGWQLSFASFAGVMLLAPIAQAYFFGKKKPGTMRQILGETIAAQIATLPLLILMFGQFSNVAILANILVLPLVPLAMLLTFIAGIGALLVPAVAAIIGLPVYWLLHYMVSVAQYVAQLPWAVSEVGITPLGAAALYLIIIAAGTYGWHKTRLSLRETNLVE